MTILIHVYLPCFIINTLDICLFYFRSWLHGVCRGLEHEPVSARQLAESIGCSKNFTGKLCLDTRDKVKHWLEELSAELEERLIKDRDMVSSLPVKNLI